MQRGGLLCSTCIILLLQLCVPLTVQCWDHNNSATPSAPPRGDPHPHRDEVQHPRSLGNRRRAHLGPSNEVYSEFTSDRLTATVDHPRKNGKSSHGNRAYDNEENLSPRMKPLNNADELLAWKPGSRPNDRATIATVPLALDNISPNNKQRRLFLSSDFSENYHNDSLSEGSYGSDYEYRVYQWDMIDIFNYFSHAFVTIPPPTWTNAAHRGGTRMLGTFIIEGDKNGADMATKLFPDKKSAQRVADQLIAISAYYGFDGYLLNIEKSIPRTKLPNLLYFVQYLTDNIHRRITGSLVIWYDAVVSPSGDVNYQNQLDEGNMDFFRATDGIFLNYWWDPETLYQNIARLQEDSQKQSPMYGLNGATDRSTYDIYVGVDVYGRGTPFRGGYDSYISLKAVAQYPLSVALFAPGWAFNDGGGEKIFSALEKRLSEFFAYLSPWLERRPLAQLPFVSNFCKGTGEKFAIDGTVVNHINKWFYLSLQTFVPNAETKLTPLVAHNSKTNPSASLIYTEWSISYEHAYNGGSSLALSGRMMEDRQYTESNGVSLFLFLTHFPVRFPLTIRYSFKNTNPTLLYSIPYLKLTLTPPMTGGDSPVIFVGPDDRSMYPVQGTDPSDPFASSRTLLRDEILRMNGGANDKEDPMEIVPPHCEYNTENEWITCTAELAMSKEFLLPVFIEQIHLLVIPVVHLKEPRAKSADKEDTDNSNPYLDYEATFALGEIAIYRSQSTVPFTQSIIVDQIQIMRSSLTPSPSRTSHSSAQVVFTWSVTDLRPLAIRTGIGADQIERFDLYKLHLPTPKETGAFLGPHTTLTEPSEAHTYAGTTFTRQFTMSGVVNGTRIGVQAVSRAGLKTEIYSSDIIYLKY
eukprot:Nk52_evm1s484 gene=Nk52_evmTU1s484